MAERNYLTVNQFSAKYPAFTQGGLRWMIFNEETNGLAEEGVIVRCGRRVLINEDRFFARLERQNAKKAA